MKLVYPLTTATILMIALAFGILESTALELKSVQPSTPTEKSSIVLSETSLQSESAAPQEISCVNLPEDNKFREQLNGTKLPLHASGIEAVSDAKITPLSNGGLLVLLDNTLYRLDAGKRIVWKYTTVQVMFDFAFIPATGFVYGTAGDGVMFVLNATNGKKIMETSFQGRGAYGMVRAYENDQCLITTNYSGYRDWKEFEKPGMKDLPTWKDEIIAYRGTKVLWHRDFPPDADLIVDGERILAVTKTRTNFYVKEISVPNMRAVR